MTMLKLARLPDRNPVKLTISIMPELHERLVAYAAVYKETYGIEEPISDLATAMLTSFLDGDRAFAKRRTVAK